MAIRKKRIRKLSTHAGGIPPGQIVVPAVDASAVSAQAAQRCGLSFPLVAGEIVLPAVVGPSTRFNVEGKDLIDRSEKESYAQVRSWTRMEFHGRDRVEVEDFITQTRQRYKRIPVPAPSMQIEIRSDANETMWVVTPEQPNDAASETSLVHQINVLLELFGECELLDHALTVPPDRRRLNWEILPQGAHPWPHIQTHLTGLIRSSPSQQAWHQHRLDEVIKHSPTFTAVGSAGMRGYVLFHFAAKGVHLLECGRYGNATYVLDASIPWEDATKMTKSELLAGNLVGDRLIHHAKKWPADIENLLR